MSGLWRGTKQQREDFDRLFARPYYPETAGERLAQFRADVEAAARADERAKVLADVERAIRDAGGFETAAQVDAFEAAIANLKAPKP